MILALHYIRRHTDSWSTPRKRMYPILDAINGLETALYFSTVTYTTLGYGDVLLGEKWHLLASFQATNGIIMFGWSTAIVVAAVQKIYIQAKHDSESPSTSDSSFSA